MLEHYSAKSGTIIPIWRIEVQIRPDDADRILDAVCEIHPLKYGRYRRNASLSAVGAETNQPEENSTTSNHAEGFKSGCAQAYPMAQLCFSIERDCALLTRVMDAVIGAHHYEEPVIYVREEWASRAAYNPHNKNPNRWWNDGRGLPSQVPFGFETK